MTHFSEKLDAMLGKKVRIKFIDGEVAEGTLITICLGPKPYKLMRPDKACNISFCKSHVKKIEKMEG